MFFFVLVDTGLWVLWQVPGMGNVYQSDAPAILFPTIFMLKAKALNLL